MKLIVNSDDYGYTQGVTEGILYGNRHGIVSSTTVLINSKLTERDISSVKNMGVGLHMNLSLGRSISNLPTLVDDKGIFLSLDKFIHNIEDIETELNAQVEKFIAVFDQLPDHIDTHHGLHRYPEIETVIRKIMKKYNLRARELSDVKLCRDFFGPNASVKSLIQILKQYSEFEVVELMCHVGFCDRDLESKSSYTTYRMQELHVLTHPEVISYINEKNIELITFGDLL